MGNTLRRVKTKLKIRPKYVRCSVVIPYDNEIVEENRNSETIAERRDNFEEIDKQPIAGCQSLDTSAPAGRIILEMETKHSDEIFIQETKTEETKTEEFRRPVSLDWDALISHRTSAFIDTCVEDVFVGLGRQW